MIAETLNELQVLIKNNSDAELYVLVDGSDVADGGNVYVGVRNSYIDYLAKYDNMLLDQDDMREYLLENLEGDFKDDGDLERAVGLKIDELEFKKYIVIVTE